MKPGPDLPPRDVRFDTLFEQAPISIQLLGKDGRTLRVNRAWKRLWQVGDDDDLLQYVLKEYNVLDDPELEAKGVTAFLRRAFDGETVELPDTYFDHRELAAPARPRWVKAMASPVMDEDGVVREVMLIHEDISARKVAELELRSSENRMVQLANSIPQLAWIADATGAVTWFNDRWYEYTGTTREEMAGSGWHAVHHPQALPWVVDLWTRSIVSGEPFQMTFPLRARDGSYRPFFTLVAPLKDENGVVQQWFGTNTDVSEQKRAEDDLRAVANELSELNRRKNEFLATLAHELRNPLAPLRNGLQILRLGAGDPAVAGRARDMMERQVNHLVRLVDDLLDVARVSGGKIELHREPVPLQTVVARAVEATMPVIEAHAHLLTVSAPAQPILVEVDAARFTQVLANILSNAAKYTPPGGRVSVAAAIDGEHAVTSIVDSGVGIPPDELPRVFDMFAQVADNLAMAQGGLGIGLSLAKTLVDLHGGELSAESAGRGKGCTFTVRLPLAEAAGRVGQAPPAETPSTRQGTPLRILVVDDNLDVGDSLALRLGLEGHQTRVARDGPSGLRAAREFQPHVAFLDIGMPGMDGYELAAAIRESGACSGATLVALTGWGSEADVARALAAGFDRHLTKPATSRSIDAILGDVVKTLAG